MKHKNSAENPQGDAAPKQPFGIWIATIALILILGAGFGLWWTKNKQSTAAPTSTVTVGNATPVESIATPTKAASKKRVSKGNVPETPVDKDPVTLVLNEFLDRAKKGKLSADDWALLKEALLASKDPVATMEAIIAFLESEVDVPTGQAFIVGAGGGLENAPTMRVFLLDVLGQLAHRDSGPIAKDVAAFSKTVFANQGSADEWAVALRNVGWTEPNAAPYLSDRFKEMLTNEQWRNRPTAGWLESFDVAVFSKDPRFVDDLAPMLENDAEKETQQAAAVALDRLAETAPLEVMQRLNTNPGLLADRPYIRADYFAKADLSVGAQKQAVEVYLGRVDVKTTEKTKFLQSLADPGSFLSDNLLTEPTPPPDDSARDAAIYKAADGWLKDNKFTEVAPALTILRERFKPE